MVLERKTSGGARARTRGGQAIRQQQERQALEAQRGGRSTLADTVRLHVAKLAVITTKANLEAIGDSVTHGSEDGGTAIRAEDRPKP